VKGCKERRMYYMKIENREQKSTKKEEKTGGKCSPKRK